MRKALSVHLGVLALLLAVLVLPQRMQAQAGSISGVVTDSTGAVVQGADVALRHLATSETHTVKTGTSGAYTVTNLPVGDYELTVKQTNFKTFRAPKITLTVAQALTVNAELQAGAASEEVTVRADSVAPVEL